MTSPSLFPLCISRIFLNNTSENIVLCVSSKQERIISLSVDWEMNNLYYIVEIDSLTRIESFKKTRLEVLDLKYLDSDGSWYQLHKSKRLATIFQRVDRTINRDVPVGLPEEFLTSPDMHRMILYPSDDQQTKYNLRQVIVHQETKKLFVLKTSSFLNKSIILQCELDLCIFTRTNILWDNEGVIDTFAVDHMHHHLSWTLGGGLYIYNFKTETLNKIRLVVFGIDNDHRDPTQSSYDSTESMKITQQEPDKLRFTQMNFINNAVYLMDDSSAFLYRFDISHMLSANKSDEELISYGEPILTSGCISTQSLMSLFVTHKERRLRFLSTRNMMPKFTPFAIQRSIESFKRTLHQKTLSSYPLEISSLICSNNEFEIPLNICPGLCLGHRDRLSKNLTLLMMCYCPMKQVIDPESFTCTNSRKLFKLFRSDGSILNYNPDDTNSLYFSSKIKTTIEDLHFSRQLHTPMIDLYELINQFSENIIREDAFNMGVFALVALPHLDKSLDDRDIEDAENISNYEPKKNLPSNLLRLAYIRYSTGDVTLYQGGPMTPYFEEDEFQMIQEGFYLVKKGRDGQYENDECSLNELPRIKEINLPKIKRKRFGNRPRWGLAFDPINHLIYWSDSKLGLIKAEDESVTGINWNILDFSDENGRRPLELIIEPRSGQLIILTGKYTGTIFIDFQLETVLLNGHDRQIILDSKQLERQQPHSFTYMSTMKSLFWIDGHSGEIKSIKLEKHLHYKALASKNIISNMKTVVEGLSENASNLISYSGESKTLISGLFNGPMLIWSDETSEGRAYFYSPVGYNQINLTPKRFLRSEIIKDFFNGENSLEKILNLEDDTISDLTWHPCFSMKEKKCSHICYQVQLEPGPLDGRDLDAKSNIFPSYSCLCPKNLKQNSSINKSASCVPTGNPVSMNIEMCESPNFVCRSGLNTRFKRPLANFNSFPTNIIGVNMQWINGQAKEVKRELMGLADTGGGQLGQFNYSKVLKTHDGICMPSSWICDGIPDCQDNSDESGCQLCSGYQCNDGNCILQSARCDGVKDCDSDELCCQDEQFECILPSWQAFYEPSAQRSVEYLPPTTDNFKSSRCIQKAEVCNQKVDCLDASDENHHSCRKNFANLTKDQIPSEIKRKDVILDVIYSKLGLFLHYIKEVYLSSDVQIISGLLIAGPLILILFVLLICLCRRKRARQKDSCCITDKSNIDIIEKNAGVQLEDESQMKCSQRASVQGCRTSCNCKISPNHSDECVYHLRPCSSFHRHVPPVPPPSSFHSPPPSQKNLCPYRIGESDSDEYCGYLGTRAMQIMMPENPHGIFGENSSAIYRPKRRNQKNLPPDLDSSVKQTTSHQNQSTREKNENNIRKSMGYPQQMISSLHHSNFKGHHELCTRCSNEHNEVKDNMIAQFSCLTERKYQGLDRRKYYEDVLKIKRSELRRKYEDLPPIRSSQSRQAPYIPPHSHLMTSSTKISRREKNRNNYLILKNHQSDSERTDQSSGQSSGMSINRRRIRQKKRRIRSNYIKMNDIRNLSDNQKSTGKQMRQVNSKRKALFKSSRTKNDTDKSDCRPKENYQSDITNPPPSPSTELNYKLKDCLSNKNSKLNRNGSGRRKNDENLKDSYSGNNRGKMILIGDDNYQQKQHDVFNSLFKQDFDTGNESEVDLLTKNPRKYSLLNSSQPSFRREAGEGTENVESDTNPQTSVNKVVKKTVSKAKKDENRVNPVKKED